MIAACVWRATWMRRVIEVVSMNNQTTVDEDTLLITVPSNDNLTLEDYRRLTGPNLLWDHPGAILDVVFREFSPEEVIGRWRVHSRRVLDAIGWQTQQTAERTFEGGVNLAVSAPMDQLYSAMFAAQTAWHFCAGELLDKAVNDFDTMVQSLVDVMAREANPRLIAIFQAAASRNVDVLSDDDHLSVGHGIGSQTWPVDKLPVAQDVPWNLLHNIPVAMITGTNGKTTTTRLSAAIAKAAGKISGLTSTDFVRVGDDILDTGDYSGPGGGRMLLRDQRLEMAYLEVARGGILRRGLPVRQARAALITNVAADHLGQYGINTVEELAQAKFAVHRTLTREGVLVLNADDTYVVAEAARTQVIKWWFSLTPDAPHIRKNRAANVPCAWLEKSTLMFFDGHDVHSILPVQDIPLTMGGAARYNILNALGAVCLSCAMGLDFEAIKTGLAGFHNTPEDNPGRCNEFAVNGARVFVDFAHNPHSISAVVDTMSAIPAKRRFVLLSHAGDRSDQDIRDVTSSVLSFHPNFVVAAELPDYLRGRAPGEISQLIFAECKRNGLTGDQIIVAGSPVQGTVQILEKLQPGDVALLLILSQRDQVFDILGQAIGPTAQ